MTKNIKFLLHNLLPVQNNWKLQLLANWDSIMGNLKTKVRLEKIYDEKLILGVSDSCWMQELYLLSPMLLTQINNALDLPRIKSLKFMKISFNTHNVERNSRDSVEKKIRMVQFSTDEQKALIRIKDRDLQQALERFLFRCYQEKP